MCSSLGPQESAQIFLKTSKRLDAACDLFSGERLQGYRLSGSRFYRAALEQALDNLGLQALFGQQQSGTRVIGNLKVRFATILDPNLVKIISITGISLTLGPRPGFHKAYIRDHTSRIAGFLPILIALTGKGLRLRFPIAELPVGTRVRPVGHFEFPLTPTLDPKHIITETERVILGAGGP